MAKKHIAALLATLLISACTKQSEPAGKVGAAPTETEKAVAVESKKPVQAKEYDGPFGLTMGISTTELVNELNFRVLVEKEPYIFIGTPPRPAEDIKKYIVVATEKTGVCRIIANLSVDVVNGSGDQIRAETDRVVELIKLKYGAYSKKYDFTSNDIYQKYPNLWMTGLNKDDVTYGYHWVVSKKSMPNSILSIQVGAYATSSSTGYVAVRYYFINDEDCDVEIKKIKAANL